MHTATWPAAMVEALCGITYPNPDTVIRSKEANHFSDILRRSTTTHRAILRHHLLDLVLGEVRCSTRYVVPRILGEHVRLDTAGRDVEPAMVRWAESLRVHVEDRFGTSGRLVMLHVEELDIVGVLRLVFSESKDGREGRRSNRQTSIPTSLYEQAQDRASGRSGCNHLVYKATEDDVTVTFLIFLMAIARIRSRKLGRYTPVQ